MPFYPVGAGGCSGSYIIRIIAESAFSGQTYTIKDEDGNTLKTGIIPSSLTVDVKILDYGNMYVECNGQKVSFVVKQPYGLTKVYLKSSIVYTLVIDQQTVSTGDSANDNDSFNICSYEDDASGMDYAYMDYDNDEFNYGSWRNAFFMPKPCMVKTDGTVDYYLDPDDYTKKLDGSASDISNDSYDGNAMIQVPTVWVYVRKIRNKTYVSLSNAQVDNNYHAYAHHDRNGNVVPYIYWPIYEGYLDSNNKLRSLSGKTVKVSTTAANEVAYSRNNGSDYLILYFSAYMLRNYMLIMMAKSLDTQASYGRGNCSTNSVKGTGGMNDKGLFWGSNGNSSGVKVLGMETPWGNRWQRCLGYMGGGAGVRFRTKLTYGTEDGTTVADYPLTSWSGLLENSELTNNNSGTYIASFMTENGNIFPKISSNTYSHEGINLSDGFWCTNTSGTYLAIVGGSYNYGGLCGTFAANLSNAASSSGASHGASLYLIPSTS